MARTKPNLSFAAAGGRPSLRISKVDWHRVEVTYGHQIAGPVRRKIREATRDYLDWASLEQNAPTVAESRGRIGSIKKAAYEFRQAILRCPPQIRREADFYARSLICKHMGLPFEGRPGLQNFVLTVEQNISKGCDLALSDLRQEESSSFRRGEMWEFWVRALTRILAKAGLPTEVRKDTDKVKAAKPSAFVSFVRELQACIPEEHRRSQALRPDFEANIALSTAIGRARSRMAGSQRPAPITMNKTRTTV